MDSSAILDCALLQLTPTRTRCDLVLVCGGKNEKMASGLVEPFISHLKFAKDQIPKGGYSITIRPPFPQASWFTKNTFQRFVRFVSTPELLERSVQIEREIMQIERAVQSNELPQTNITGNDGAQEETSKFHLQRVLEARKVLLQKEQAMAYARAIVAGFEMDIVDNLICFADAFGALRLREACEDFKELYKKKHSDGQWMEELAAMKASSLQDLSHVGTSGVMLAYENNSSSQNNGLSFQSNGVPVSSAVSNCSSDAPSELTATPPFPDSTSDNNTTASVHMPLFPGHQVPWTNQIPQYLYLPRNQQIPPYPGCTLPNAHHLPPFYSGHPFWPQTTDKPINANDQVFNNGRYHKSARKKKKSSYAGGPETLEYDEETEPSDSDSEDEVDAMRMQDRKYSSRNKRHVKKHSKSSKTVVIRNINYITSKRRNGDKNGMSEDSSSGEAVSLDEVSNRREVAEAVASFETHADSKGLNHENGSHHQNGTDSYANQDLTFDLAGKIIKGEEKNENWSAFQSLLRSHGGSTSNGVQHENFQDEHLAIHKSDNNISFKASNDVDLVSEKDKKQNLMTDDSTLLTRSNVGGEVAPDSVGFANGETICMGMKKRDYQDIPLIVKNLDESSGNSLAAPSEFASSTIIRNRWKDENCFIVDRAGYAESEAKHSIFESYDTTSYQVDSYSTETSKNTASIDDSFMVHSRPEVDYNYDSQWRTDISTVVGWTLAQNENGDANVADSKLEIPRINEPDDLCVMLVRDDQSEPTETSWTPKLDYGMDMYVAEIDKSSSAIELKSPIEAKLPVNDKSRNTKTNAGSAHKASINDARSKVLQRSTAKSKTAHPTNRMDIKKSKLQMEEEVCKRMEELVIQRQNRIAERTAAGGLTPAASKRIPGGCKPAASKVERRSPHSLLAETKILSSSKSGTKIW